MATNVALLLGAGLLGLGGWYFAGRKPLRTLPYINVEMIDTVPRQSIAELSDTLHKVSDFHLTDQTGKTVSLADFKGSVFVADFFFTTCQGICPIMNTQLKRVYEKFKGNTKIKFASFTVDPARDTVEAMNRYAQRHGADPAQWHFITGPKPELYQLGRASFAVVATKGNGGTHDFIHSNLFVLVDRDLHIRGYYDGTNAKEVDQLMEDIPLLLEN